MLNAEKDNEETIIDLKTKLETVTSILAEKEQMSSPGKNILELFEHQKKN